MIATSPSDVRLSQLITRWTLVFQAHSADSNAVREAQTQVLMNYCPAIYRYLVAIVREESLAEELAQEFAFRFVRGDFRHARPEHGRFRDYLKISLRHLVQEYFEKQRQLPKSIAFDSKIMRVATTGQADHDDRFREEWTLELLARTWARFRGIDAEPELMFRVLHRKSQAPELRSADLAAEFTTELHREISVANIRQLLHRAREEFAALLRAEVAATLGHSDPERVEEELAELGLLIYCT